MFICRLIFRCCCFSLSLQVDARLLFFLICRRFRRHSFRQPVSLHAAASCRRLLIFSAPLLRLADCRCRFRYFCHFFRFISLFADVPLIILPLLPPFSLLPLLLIFFVSSPALLLPSPPFCSFRYFAFAAIFHAAFRFSPFRRQITAIRRRAIFPRC